ncbi:MAG: prolyl oligopeptidase family serine peptidase [Bacteroidota bacterium]|nr:prolyl oligopeptidase family serine peptidase [Bacteroidota bacterium]
MEKQQVKFKGAKEKNIHLDFYHNPKIVSKALVLFVHGFKGFKDWGPWELMSNNFVKAGFAFAKFNFSFNGIEDNPEEITDLESFSENNLSTEIQELGIVLDELKNLAFNEIYGNNIYLIGHSKGGGLAILNAVYDQRIEKVASWAGVCSFNRFAAHESPKKWKEDGKIYLPNKRTGQLFPVKYQYYEDYHANKDKLDILEQARKFDKPLLLVHGTKDETVPLKEAKRLNEVIPQSILIEIEGANHVFGSYHKYQEDELPNKLQQVVEETIEFFDL